MHSLQVAYRARLFSAAIENVKQSFDCIAPLVDLHLNTPTTDNDLDQALDNIHYQPEVAFTLLNDSLKLLQEQSIAYAEVVPK